LDSLLSDISFSILWQVDWSPWASFMGRHGFAAARRFSQARRLLRHEYGFVFYLGERVIRQHSPLNQLCTPAFPPSTMRRPNATPPQERIALVEGIPYHSFLLDMPYDVFAATYLLGDAPGIPSSVIYDRYATLGGNPDYIRGQSHLLLHAAEPAVPAPGADAAVGDQGVVPPQDVPGEVRVDIPPEGMGDTQGQRARGSSIDPRIILEGPFVSMSDLFGARLAPERASGGVQIREGGSTGVSATLPRVSTGDRGKAPAVEGEGSEADLAAFIRSTRDLPRDAVPPSGPGESSSVVELPDFPRELAYTVVTEPRSHPIRSVPTPEPMTLPGRSGDEVDFLHSFFLIVYLFSADIFSLSGDFCEGGQRQISVRARVELLCLLDLCGA